MGARLCGRTITSSFGEAAHARRRRGRRELPESLESDGIFSDGYSLQLATMTGSVEQGFVATLNVPV